MPKKELTSKEKVEAIAKVNNLSRDDIAKLLHVSRRTVDRWFSDPALTSYRLTPHWAAEIMQLKFPSKG